MYNDLQNIQFKAYLSKAHLENIIRDKNLEYLFKQLDLSKAQLSEKEFTELTKKAELLKRD